MTKKTIHAGSGGWLDRKKSTGTIYEIILAILIIALMVLPQLHWYMIKLI